MMDIIERAARLYCEEKDIKLSEHINGYDVPTHVIDKFKDFDMMLYCLRQAENTKAIYEKFYNRVYE